MIYSFLSSVFYYFYYEKMGKASRHKNKRKASRRKNKRKTTRYKNKPFVLTRKQRLKKNPPVKEVEKFKQDTILNKVYIRDGAIDEQFEGKGEFLKATLGKIDLVREKISIKYENKQDGDGREIDFKDLSSLIICCDDIDSKKIRKFISSPILKSKFLKWYDKYGEAAEDSYPNKDVHRNKFAEGSFLMLKKYNGNILFLETDNGMMTKILLGKGIPPKSLFACNKGKGICEILQKKYPNINVVHDDIKNVFEQNPQEYCSVWFDMEETLASFEKPSAFDSDSFHGFVMINLSLRARDTNDDIKGIREILLKNATNVEAERYKGRSGKFNMACGFGEF